MFIDRSGRLFEHVLQFLRTGAVEVADPSVRLELATEAAYFQLAALQALLPTVQDPVMAGRAMCKQAELIGTGGVVSHFVWWQDQRQQSARENSPQCCWYFLDMRQVCRRVPGSDAASRLIPVCVCIYIQVVFPSFRFFNVLFRSCDFRGVTFTDCNFHSEAFVSCDLRCARFVRCQIVSKQAKIMDDCDLRGADRSGLLPSHYALYSAAEMQELMDRCFPNCHL